jgi:hypothetical protein
MRKFVTAAALIAMLAVPTFTAFASGGENGNGHKITICHATPPDTAANGYESITVDTSAQNFVAHRDEHDADIIPPFGDFPGKNWDADGQAIYRNDCEVPEPPEPPSVGIRPTCNDDDVGEVFWRFGDGDFDGAVLVIKRDADGLVVLRETEGSGSFLARAGSYTWTVYFEHQGILRGTFEVEQCYETCSSTIRVPQEPTYSDWSDWEWDEGQSLWVRTRTKTTVVLIVDARDKETICGRGVIEEIEEQTREPDEVIVGVELACAGRPGKGTVYQLIFGVTVEPAGGATVFFNGNEYTSSTGGHIGFGSYDWSAEAADGFVIQGDDEGTVKLSRDDCNPEKPPPTGGPGALVNDPVFLAGAGSTGLLALGAGAVRLWRKRGR